MEARREPPAAGKRNMTTVQEYIRKHLLEQAGIFVDIKRMPSIERLRVGQWSKKFESLRRNRMILGAFRYGQLENQKKTGSPYNNTQSIIARTKEYERTGNTEFLVDIANLAMIEFTIGVHPTKHFQSMDDGIHTERRV